MNLCEIELINNKMSVTNSTSENDDNVCLNFYGHKLFFIHDPNDTTKTIIYYCDGTGFNRIGQHDFPLKEYTKTTSDSFYLPKISKEQMKVFKEKAKKWARR